MPAPEGSTLCLEHLEEAELDSAFWPERVKLMKKINDAARHARLMSDPEAKARKLAQKREQDARKRERMRKLRAANPEYHEQEKARRREADAKRRLEDPEWAERQRARKRVGSSHDGR